MANTAVRLVALSLLFAVASSSAPRAESGWRIKVDPWVLGAAPAAEREFLVFLDEQADLTAARALPSKDAKGSFVFARLTETAARAQAPLVDALRARGLWFQRFWIADMILVRGRAADVEALARRADVRHVYANPRVAMVLPVAGADPGDRVAGVEWNIALVGAPAMWAAGFTGQGAVVAGEDTGYEWNHAALKSHYRGWNGTSVDHNYHWHDAIHSGGGVCGPDSPEPCDDYGHGTHTMGTMVGDDGAGNQIGMAPGARWIGCRNMDQGNGTPATYSECFQWFLAPTDLANQNPDPSKAPHVINNSWGCPASEGCTDPNVLKTVVESVRAAGIVVVVSAGNAGPGCSTVNDPPAIYDASFSVGATDMGDVIADLSSRGPVTVDGSNRHKPDVSAPGINVRSCVPQGGYASLSGTSMAGPHVAGLTALLISANGALAGDVDGVELQIEGDAVAKSTSQSCGGTAGQVPNDVYGWGRIQTPACLPLTLSPPVLPTAIVGAPYLQTVTAAGGTAPYTFQLAAGTLPGGISLSMAGVLSGTPVSTGSFAFTVAATDATGCSGSRAYVLTVVTAFTGDHIVGQGFGPGNANRVRVFTGAGTATPVDIMAYASGSWGATVASGDVDGDGLGEILTGPGPGAALGPQVRGFRRDGSGLARINFYAYGTLRFGVNVAAGSIDADAFDEIETGAGPGAVFGPHVRAFDFDAATVAPVVGVSFYGYGTLRYGINLSAGDVDGDGYAELVTGPGPSPVFAPQVRGFDHDGAGIGAVAGLDFVAFAVSGYGANVAAGDVDSDAFADIAVAPGPGASHPARFRGFSFAAGSVATLVGFDTTPFASAFGGRVGLGDVDGLAGAELLCGAGRDPAADSTVRPFGYDGVTLAPLPTFVPFGTAGYGVNVAAGTLDY